jgi:hypothetical protein
MTYTLVVFFLLGHGPGEGRFEKSVTPISDYTTCMHLEHAINLKDSPHLAICKVAKARTAT